MNMKDTAILLIFLLSVLGLIIGIHYTEDASIEKTQNNELNSIDEDANSQITIIIHEKNSTHLNNWLT